MELADALLVAVAGLVAGAINTVVGSGTLVTFPALLAAGYPPLVANVSNGIGLVPGSVAGAIGYRRELAGQRDRAVRLASASILGAAAGAVLLLVLPESAFEAIVPIFVAFAVVLVALGPRLSALVEARRDPEAHAAGRVSPGMWGGVGALGIYGGYFGAAQGIMLLALLGPLLPDDLQRINALKNVLAGLVNAVSGAIFIAVADPAWEAVAVVAVSSAAGAVLGSRYGRRLSPAALRGVVVGVGVAAFVLLVT